MATYTFPESGGLKLNKDHVDLMTAEDCQPGAFGYFTTAITLAMVAQYTTNTYSVWANQTGGTEILGVLLDCTPVDQYSFKVIFFNGSGNVVPADTVMTISFATLGI